MTTLARFRRTIKNLKPLDLGNGQSVLVPNSVVEEVVFSSPVSLTHIFDILTAHARIKAQDGVHFEYTFLSTCSIPSLFTEEQHTVFNVMQIEKLSAEVRAAYESASQSTPEL